MSIHEIRPQFTSSGGPSPKLKVDPRILRNGIQELLNDIVLGRNITVDIVIRDTLSSENEWRICIPPHEREIYRAIGGILNYKNAIYSAHVERGTMQPREFIVNVWCRSSKDNVILGSFD